MATFYRLPDKKYLTICLLWALNILQADSILLEDRIVTQSKTVLAVGINKYHSFRNLEFAAKDALDVSNFFIGLSDISQKPQVMTDLMDNDYPTRKAILNKIDRNLSNMVNEEDSFIFFFSGHGYQDKLMVKKNQEIDIFKDIIHNPNFTKGQLILLLDACREDSFQLIEKLKAITLNRQQTVSIILSTADDHISHEEKSMQNGVFTHFLLQALAEKAINQRKEVRISNVFSYVKQKVLLWSSKKSFHNDDKRFQNPVLVDLSYGKDYLFFRKEPKIYDYLVPGVSSHFS